MGLFLVAGIITTGIAIYAPATALSAVTAMNLDIAILSTGIVWALKIPCPIEQSEKSFTKDRTRKLRAFFESVYFIHQ